MVRCHPLKVPGDVQLRSAIPGEQGSLLSRGRTAYAQASKLVQFRQLLPPSPTLPIHGSRRIIFHHTNESPALTVSRRSRSRLDDNCLHPYPPNYRGPLSIHETPKHTRAMTAAALQFPKFEDGDVDIGGLISGVQAWVPRCQA